MDQLVDWQGITSRHSTPKTFELAAASYVEHGGDNRYLPKIVEYFEGKLLVDIYPFDIRNMATALYPEHMNSTRNRQAITPARAVIIHGYERGWCNMIRIRNFKIDKAVPKVPASHMWMHLFARQCEDDNLPHLAACVMFMSHTGARVSEAIELKWAQVDLQQRQALLLRTKTGKNSERFLTDELVSRLYKLQIDTRPEDRVFRYSTRWSVNDRIMAVCRRAGLTYKPSHTCGRKSFATNAIAMGIDVRTAMDAGDWKSADLFLKTYVHMKNSGRRVAERFNSNAYDSTI